MPDNIPPLESSQSVPQKGTNGKYMLRATDPEGYEIRLELETWEGHIVKQHPEMKRFSDLLVKTITEPQLIQHSSRQGETFYYYRLTGRAFSRANDIYLSLVVRRDESTKTGTIKTAHLLKAVRQDGETVWMKRN